MWIYIFVENMSRILQFFARISTEISTHVKFYRYRLMIHRIPTWKSLGWVIQSNEGSASGDAKI